VTHTPVVKVRTEAQQARIKRKYQRMKEKRLERERHGVRRHGIAQASEQHRLAKRLNATSDPDAVSCPQATPIHPAAMEVDQPAAKGETPEDQVQSTSQAQPHQTAYVEPNSEDAWLAAPGLLLDGLPEIETVYPQLFYTQTGPPNQK